MLHLKICCVLVLTVVDVPAHLMLLWAIAKYLDLHQLDSANYPLLSLKWVWRDLDLTMPCRDHLDYSLIFSKIDLAILDSTTVVQQLLVPWICKTLYNRQTRMDPKMVFFNRYKTSRMSELNQSAHSVWPDKTTCSQVHRWDHLGSVGYFKRLSNDHRPPE